MPLTPNLPASAVESVNEAGTKSGISLNAHALDGLYNATYSCGESWSIELIPTMQVYFLVGTEKQAKAVAHILMEELKEEWKKKYNLDEKGFFERFDGKFFVPWFKRVRIRPIDLWGRNEEEK